MAQPQTQKRGNGFTPSPQQPLQDMTPSRVYHEYDLPEELWDDAKTMDFGEIRTIGMKLLTPLEEKTAVGRARGDQLRMGYELSEAAVAFVIDASGQTHRVQLHDGTTNMLFAQLHPKIRTLVVQAYSEDAVPTPKAGSDFLKSRRIKV